MKYFFFLFLVIAKIGFGQKVFIPYRVGNKFGLADEKGTLVIQPTYDKMEYVKDDYCKSSRKLVITDSFKLWDGRTGINKREVNWYSLYKKNKLLIQEQEFPHFLIYKYLIAASRNEFHPEDCALYNLRGEKLIAEPVKGLDVNDARDFGELATASTQVSLISIFQRDEKNNRIFSIALYDNAAQKISGWLLKKVSSYRLLKRTGDKVFCSFMDEKGFHEKVIYFQNNRFAIRDKMAADDKTVAGNGGFDNEEKYVVEVGKDYAITEMPEIEDKVIEQSLSEEEQERRGLIYYYKKGDSLFYVKSAKNIYVPLPTEVTLIPVYKNLSGQSQSVIYQQGNKYGLVSKGNFTPAMFDTLLYYGNNFIAGKADRNGLRFGIIDRHGTELLSFIYDSIQGNMKSLRVDWKQTPTTSEKKLVLRAKDYSSLPNDGYHMPIANTIVVYKNGKAGLLNANYQTLLPPFYDTLAEVDDMFISRAEKGNYILLKKDGLYGTAQLVYEKEKTAYVLTNALSPRFSQIPVFYINDYYGVKGYTIYGIYNEQFRFLGYANKEGKVYYKD